LYPDIRWIDRYIQEEGFKILLCHHPEYYNRYLKEKNIGLILSGHAHGGQIRIFGRGLYAPGQGVLPKHDGGVFENRLVVGRGLANTAFFPRFFNPCEIVTVDLE
jgi:predicted MPP superfamily phosphohydrolase